MHPRERHGSQRTVQTNVFKRSGVRFLGEVSQILRNHWEHIHEANELEEGQQGITKAATTVVHTFTSSQAHLLILESTPYLLKSAGRRVNRGYFRS